MMTLARDKSGSFWQIDGAGPLIETDVCYDRREKHWCLTDCWRNDVPFELSTEQREEVEAWFDANVLYDWSE